MTMVMHRAALMHRRANSGVKKEQGIALLMALLIVALVSILSVQMISQRQLQIYRTSNLLTRDQAYQFSLGVERWGLSVIYQDFKKNKAIDSHQDVWSTARIDFTVERAELDGYILDLQGRFNLNNLIKNGKVQIKWFNFYKRLLNSLNLPQELAETLLDWIDKNEQPTGSVGAEDIYYIALDEPYRTANQPLVNLSELLLVKGYNAAIIKTLLPHVFVAKVTTPINVNTSTGVVFQAVTGLSANQAETLLEQADRQPFVKVNDFIKDPLLSKVALDPRLFSVVSNYFAVNGFVSVDKAKINMQSIIRRDVKGNVRVISRKRSISYVKKIKGESDE